MIWILKLVCSLIFIQSTAYGFPLHVPEWNHHPSSGRHPPDWMYNYGAPPVDNHHSEHDHDHEKDHHHVNQQQIIIHDSSPTTLTAKESYRVSNGNVIQDMITHITTTGVDYENESTPGDNTVKVKKIKRDQPNFKTRSSNNNRKRTRSTKKKSSSKPKKSSNSKQRGKTTSSSKSKQPYRSRKRFCEFDELCRYQQLQSIRRRPYFDYDYYNPLPFRYNRFRYRDPLPYNSELNDDFYDYVENTNPRPAKQQTSSESNSDETSETTDTSSTPTEPSTMSTEMSTTTVATTTITNNVTGYGYGPSNGNENVSFTTVIPGRPENNVYFDYAHPGSQGNDYYSIVSYSNPNKLNLRSTDHDIFVRSATEQVVAKVKETIG